MTFPTAAALRTSAASAVGLRNVYLGGLAFWLVTRWLVLVHQGAWPWMNAFVVAAARGIVVGDWNEAVRPQLPAVLGVPLVLAGATEQQMVAALYLLASLVQFAAFVVLVRAVFPGRLEEQTLGLLVFLVVPFNHSIHQYRDMPVVLASAAIFLISADFVRTHAHWRTTTFSPPEPALSDQRGEVAGANAASAELDPELAGPDRAPKAAAALPSRPVERSAAAASAAFHRSSPASPPPARPSFSAKRNQHHKQNGIQSVTPSVTWGGSARHNFQESVTRSVVARHKVAEARRFGVLALVMLLGIWSRIEMLTFVAILVFVGILVLRRRALRAALTYSVAAIVVTASLLVVYRIENVDLSQAWFYTAHTFLDSTPDSWLTPACQANPTENCREADGLGYFGPADLHAGVLALAMNHPLTTLAKSIRSAWDNAWVLFGPNPSTFPGILPFVILVAAAMPLARELYGQVPKAVWIVIIAVVAESLLPPLTWAPPHPQYHVAVVLPMVLLVVPALVALRRMPRGRLAALVFLAANAGLSAFRYTRYAGY